MAGAEAGGLKVLFGSGVFCFSLGFFQHLMCFLFVQRYFFSFLFFSEIGLNAVQKMSSTGLKGANHVKKSGYDALFLLHN